MAKSPERESETTDFNIPTLHFGRSSLWLGMGFIRPSHFYFAALWAAAMSRHI
jgi:hypothetical protein